MCKEAHLGLYGLDDNVWAVGHKAHAAACGVMCKLLYALVYVVSDCGRNSHPGIILTDKTVDGKGLFGYVVKDNAVAVHVCGEGEVFIYL